MIARGTCTSGVSPTPLSAICVDWGIHWPVLSVLGLWSKGFCSKKAAIGPDAGQSPESLNYGVPHMKALLAGYLARFRPHLNSRRRSGQNRTWGQLAELLEVRCLLSGSVSINLPPTSMVSQNSGIPGNSDSDARRSAAMVATLRSPVSPRISSRGTRTMSPTFLSGIFKRDL